ncbi:MAG: PilZ domain-containing protein, partial [Phycisphaerales bacterium]
MSKSKTNSNQRNSLGLNKLVYGKLLEKLESAAEEAANIPPKRMFTRLEYLDPYFELVLDATNHSQRRKISVATRNISRGGMSILHSSFIYPGTQVNASLRKTSGAAQKITGKVCRCEHRGGVVHEVGIKFDKEIVIQEFVKPGILEGVKSLEKVNPNALKGKILFIGTDATITPFIREYLLTTSLNYGFEDDAEDALHKDLSEYDLLFVSLDAGQLSGPEFIRCVRDSGYKKPIILSGRSNDCESTIQQIRFSTADLFLPVPITENSLLCALGEFLINSWDHNTLEKVRNSVDL